MNKYLSVLKLGLKNNFQYRFSYLMSVLLTPISLIIYYFLWSSIFAYSGQEVLRGFTFNDMVSYYAISMIVGTFVWTGVDDWMEHDIRMGHVVADLLRPIGYFSLTYIHSLSSRLLSIFIEILPLFIIAVLFFGIKITPLNYLLLFLIALVLASILNFLFTYIFGLAAFWLNRTSGIRRMRGVVVSFLSGSLIPLNFFPVGFQSISRIMPFEYIRFAPINIYLGKYALSQIGFVFLMQIVWIAILSIAVVFIWRAGLKRFTGVGA